MIPEKLINKIIRHYLRIYNGRDIGPDVLQEVWVALLEKYYDLYCGEYTDEKTRIELWKTLHGLTRDKIKSVRNTNESIVPDNLRVVQADLDLIADQKCINDAAQTEMIVDLTSLLYSQTKKDCYKTPQLVELLLDGNIQKEEQPTIAATKEVLIQVNNIKTYFHNSILSSYYTYYPSPLYNRISKTGTLTKILTISQNNSKYFHSGYNRLCHVRYGRIIKPDVIDEIIDLYNKGLSILAIYDYFSYTHTTPRRFNRCMRASYFNIKAIVYTLEYAGVDLAEAYQIAPDDPQRDELNTLESLDQYLNKRNCECHLVYDNQKYLLIHQKCRRCHKKKMIHVFEDTSTSELVWCCMRCREKGRHELHKLYLTSYGKDLTGLFNHIIVETEEDYSLV